MVTEVGGITFLPMDDPADWEPGGAAWDRSASLFEDVGALIRSTGPDHTAQRDEDREEGVDGRER
ncbi:MAG TPA: hypothetical protein VFA96_02300 [Nocardioides sp.]|nr:hypothetical protein [Nocardioides sp.]